MGPPMASDSKARSFLSPRDGSGLQERRQDRPLRKKRVEQAIQGMQNIVHGLQPRRLAARQQPRRSEVDAPELSHPDLVSGQSRPEGFRAEIGPSVPPGTETLP